MARTPSVSDEEILKAAQAVINERGPDAFTLAEVAARVGLSRAAIILRFKSTQELKITLLRGLVNQFIEQMASLPVTASGESLLAVADFIGNRLTTRENLRAFLMNHFSNLKEPELADLEIQRGTAWHDVISRCMPPIAIDHEAAVAAFSAHLSGTLLSWTENNNESCRDFMERRTRQWLQLAGITLAPGDRTEASARQAKQASA